MLKNKENKPLYMKKSKAAKQRELEIDEDEKNDYFIEGIRSSPRKGEKYRRSKSKGRAQQREYFDDDDLYERQYENNKVYETEEDMSEYYTVDERRYRRRKPEMEYYEREFECSNSDCSVGCTVCEKSRNRRPEMWDYEYEGHRDQGRPRGDGDWYSHPRRTHRRRRHYSEFDDRMPYVNNSKYIYLEREPSGHRAFTDNEALDVKQTSTATENDSELYYHKRDHETSKKIKYKLNDDKSESDAQYSYRYEEKYEGSRARKFPRGKKGHDLKYHVYSTQVDDKAGTAFMQHNGIHKGKEEIQLLVGLKNSESSTVVQLPVVYSRIQKQGKRIMSPKELRKVLEERPAEKSLETNMLVYAATNNEQENIFKKEQNKVEAANLINGLQNISVYHATQDDNPLQENESRRQLVDTMESPLPSVSVNKFPVDNAYIMVASLNKSGSSHSLIGSTGKGRIRGSGFFSKANKIDKKLQELKKKKSKNKIVKNTNSPDTDPESIISVIDPIRHEDEYQESREGKRLTKSKSKEKNENEKNYFDDAGKNRKKTIAPGEKDNNANDQSKRTKAKQNDNNEDARKGAKYRKIAASVWNINPSKRQSGKKLNKKVSKSRQNIEEDQTMLSEDQDIETPRVEQKSQVATNKKLSKSRQSNEAKTKRLSKDQDIETPRVEEKNQVPSSKSLESFIDSIEKKEDIHRTKSLRNVKSLETAVIKNKMAQSIEKKEDDIQQKALSKNVKSSDAAVIKDKKTRNIFRRKKRVSPVDDTKSSQTSLHAKERGLVKRMPSKERSIQWSETETRETAIIKKHNDTMLVKLFKATVIFLGIDMHGSMIKCFNCFEEE